MPITPVIDLPVVNLALAESNAIKALASWLNTPEGQAADETMISLWMFERGWPPGKWRAWAERIAAQQALADPDGSDPTLLHARLNVRLERLAHRAEAQNDMKHAIQATEAQAKLNKAGGYAPPNAPQVAIQINQNTAHLVSDEELARIAASAKPAELWE